MFGWKPHATSKSIGQPKHRLRYRKGNFRQSAAALSRKGKGPSVKEPVLSWTSNTEHLCSGRVGHSELRKEKRHDTCFRCCRREPQQQVRLSTPVKTNGFEHPARSAPQASFLRLYPTAPQTALVSMDHVGVERSRWSPTVIRKRLRTMSPLQSVLRWR